MINNSLEKNLTSPKQELGEFKNIVEKKSEINFGEKFNALDEQKKIEIIKKGLQEHKDLSSHRKSPEYAEKAFEAESIVLRLSPDKDDKKMEELLGLMEDVGILNTIESIEKTESFHILDDFHRLLVQYIKSGNETTLKEKLDIYPGLHMTLFKIQLPSIDREEDKGKKLEELLSSMEQFYSGMFALADNGVKNYFSIEISFPQGSDQVSFFCAIPDEKSGLFKNQILAIFSDAKISEITDDYNIFNGLEYVSGSILKFEESEFLPIKSYKDLDYDPINIILQSFNNLDKTEGASIQIVLSPSKKNKNQEFDKKIDALNEGKDIKSSLAGDSGFLLKTINSLHEAFFEGGEKKEEKDIKDKEKRSILVEQLKIKNSSRLYNSNIRFITAGNNQSHSDMIRQELESSFLQFENVNGNKFKFKKVEERDMDSFVKKYTFRVFDKKDSIILNTTELTSLFHFPRQKLGVGDILSSSNTAGAQVSYKIKSVQGNYNEDVFKKDIILEKKVQKNDSFKISDLWENDNQDVVEENILENNTQEFNTDNPFANYQLNKEEFFQEEDNYLKGKIEYTQNKIETKKEIFKEKEKNNSIVENINKNPPLIEDKKQNNLGGLKNMGDDSLKTGSNIILGINEYQGVETPIYLQPLDRMRHLYVIGQTGTGKTTLLKNMIVQDIKNGDGVCFIDPHGSDIEDILANIPPERHDDVIYFDPAYLDRPMGLNMLEYDPRYPEQKSFVVNEMLAIFEKLFDMKKSGSGGPMFEMYFRNAVLLTIDNPEDKATLLDVVRVLSDKEYRKQKLEKSTNVTVNQFWTKIAEQAGGDASMENVIPYITSKFDGFLSNDYMRPIISQEKSAFNFREVMDGKKILLINLSKGRLGELNSSLIGLIVVGKILMAALSRVDSLDKNLPPFYLYIDEFQNVTTDSISSILSEARKYKLSLNIAHQYIKQIDEGIKDAIFGNVGSMAVFRVGQEDAEFLKTQFEPTFTAQNIASIDNRNAYLKMLVDGEPQKPFNIRTLAPEEGSQENAEIIKNLSRQRYGKDRKEIEDIIRKKISYL